MQDCGLHGCQECLFAVRALICLYFYSNSNPEDRRVGPENINGRKKFKVVYVVLESQYQSSMTVACKRINAVQVNYLSLI